MNENMVKDIVTLIGGCYDGMYNRGETGTREDINNFDLLAAMFPDLLAQIVKARGDMFTSDRECAAYSRVVRSYLKHLSAAI